MRFHRGRCPWGRDSFRIPQFAVVGASDTGTYADSPARSEVAREELEGFRAVLRANGIRSRLGWTLSGNVFMTKRWVVVHSKDYAEASRLAEEYLREHAADTRLLHDAA